MLPPRGIGESRCASLSLALAPLARHESLWNRRQREANRSVVVLNFEGKPRPDKAQSDTRSTAWAATKRETVS